MWIYKGAELGLEGINGVPNRDMTDEEFAEASAKIRFQHRTAESRDALANSGLWVHESVDNPEPEIVEDLKKVSKFIEKETNKSTDENDGAASQEAGN